MFYIQTRVLFFIYKHPEYQMAVQSLGASFFEGKLALSWDVMTETKSLLVNVAKDAEFTNSSRQFLIPPSTSSLHLDCGMGTWYVRIGALIGDDSAGMVDWSGIQGPVVVASTKGNPEEPPILKGRKFFCVAPYVQECAGYDD
jgi:hypothetical protein